MFELLQESLRLHHFPLTFCFGLVILFWIATIVGVADTDALEPDVDLDVDADAGAGSSFGMGAGRFFNLGEVPLAFLLTVLIALMWLGSLWLNRWLNPNESLLIAAGLLLVNFVICLFLTKFLTAPLKPLMRSLKAGAKHRPVVGRSCVVKTSEVTETFGQAEAEDESGNPLLLNVRISADQKPIAKGERALIVETLDQGETYLVRKLDA